eukprot:PhM_4_TR9383/c0_g1_i1/m.70772
MSKAASLNTLGTLGLFSQPSYMGDEYDRRNNIKNDRHKGRNFVTSPGKKGAGPDTTFSQKVLSLSEGDKYVDPGLPERRHRMEENKKRLGTGVFRQASPMKRSTGAGSTFGTFGTVDDDIAHKHADERKTKEEFVAPRYEPKKRYIYTNPMKKGTFGYPGLTIGQYGESRDKSDPYEGERRYATLQEKLGARKAMGPAFKASCRRQDTFDETSHGVSRVYSLDRQLPVRRINVEPPKAPIVPWVPSNPPRRGFNCTKIINYKEDPLDEKEKIAREKRRADHASSNAKGRWLPISGPKSMATRTIDLNV